MKLELKIFCNRTRICTGVAQLIDGITRLSSDGGFYTVDKVAFGLTVSTKIKRL